MSDAASEPSDKRQLLIVGVGSIGERHLRCFLRTGRVEISICETNEALRESTAQKYSIARAHATIADAIGAGQWDAAVVATPAHTHIPIAQQLADAGVHLLIEKPLSTSLDGVEALRQTVSRHKLVAGVAYVYRAHPALAAMREAIRSGRFGEPKQITVVSGQHFPTYRPAYRRIYYTKHETGGGAIQDGITHLMNAGEWLLGPIGRLCCDAQHQALEGVDVEDTVNVLTRQGDAMGAYTMTQFQSPNETSITVHCVDGSTKFDVHHNRWQWVSQRGGPWQDEPIIPLERDDWFTRQAQAFLDALDGTKPLLCPLDEGVQTLRVNLAMLRSSQHQQWLDVGEASTT